MTKVIIREKEYEFAPETSLLEVSRAVRSEYPHDLFLCRKNGILRELMNPVGDEDCTLEFIDGTGICGYEAFKRTAILLFLKAFYDVTEGVEGRSAFVEFSMGTGYFIRVRGVRSLDPDFLDKIRRRMSDLSESDEKISKLTIPTHEAIRRFRSWHTDEKAELFRFRRASRTNLYEIGGYQDYFYGYMLPGAGLVKYYDLCLYHDGIILELPDRRNPETVVPFVPQEKLFATLSERTDWCRKMNAATVGALNNQIVDGTMSELVLVQEAMMEKKLGEIAEEIASDHKRKLVLIAGPSSSGKTTFSHRLSVQLKAYGLNPHPIGTDDFFRDRDVMPLDEDGKPNYEDLECVDVELFNRCMNGLLAGEEVELPHFNFKTGRQEFRGDRLKLGKNDVLVMEGIHCLNPKMTYALDDANKYRIYLSALTTLNLDEHNRMSTSDGRLIRRMVRDARTRGTKASETLSRWESVRRGEKKNIFPYQETADVMFNSNLVYEMNVLKTSATALLYTVQEDDPNYQEAMRLLKLLDYVLGMDSSGIPNNSIVREFIGGSCFDVG